MGEDPESTLRAALGDEALAGLGALDPEDLERLTEQLGDARRRQRAALREAGDEALGHVPRLLRGPVRRVVLR